MTTSAKRIFSEINAVNLDKRGLFDGQAFMELVDESCTAAHLILTPNWGFFRGARVVFLVELRNYPHSFPRVSCLTKVFHPNISYTGSVCFNFLSEGLPDTPFSTLAVSLLWLLDNPNPASALNGSCRGPPNWYREQVVRSMFGETVAGTSFTPYLNTQLFGENNTDVSQLLDAVREFNRIRLRERGIVNADLRALIGSPVASVVWPDVGNLYHMFTHLGRQPTLVVSPRRKPYYPTSVFSRWSRYHAAVPADTTATVGNFTKEVLVLLESATTPSELSACMLVSTGREKLDFSRWNEWFLSQNLRPETLVLASREHIESLFNCAQHEITPFNPRHLSTCPWLCDTEKISGLERVFVPVAGGLSASVSPQEFLSLFARNSDTTSMHNSTETTTATTSSSTTEAKLEVEYFTKSEEEELRLVSDRNNWDVKSGVPLVSPRKGQWTLTVPKQLIGAEWKLVVLRKDGSCRWESGDNRRMDSLGENSRIFWQQ